MGSQRSKYEGVIPASASSIKIDFQFQGERCRERIKLEPTPANLKRAAQHRAAILASIAAGTFDYAVTFPRSKNAKRFMRQDRVDIYLRNWLKAKKPTIKASTWKDYNKTIEGQLIPEFGAFMLAELRRGHVRDWASKLTCSNKRIANLISPLRTALEDAMHDEMIPANPLAGWFYRKKEAPQNITDREPDPFSHEEQAAILASASTDGRPLLQFAFWTGLRTSELIALEWGDIDWQGSTCRISRAITQAAKSKAESPKTAAGARTIDLLLPAIQALKAQKPYSSMHGSGRVFINPRTGEPWTGDQALRKTLWTHVLRRAGVRYRRQYQTRHTFASMMISTGEPLAWVARQMGHTSVVTTTRIYARWIPSTGTQPGMKASTLFPHQPPFN